MLLNILLFYYFSRRGYSVDSDTYEYVGHFIYRSPVYPVFLDAVRAVCGPDYFYAVALLQTALIQVAASFLSSALSDIFCLPLYAFALINAVLLLPLFDVFSGIGGAGAAIMSEGLSYAIFLVALVFAARAVSGRDVKSAVCFAAVAAFSTLLRAQLAFLQPAALFVAIIVFRRSGIRAALPVCIMLLCGMVVSSGMERIYNRLENGYSGRVSVVPLHMAGKMLYFSSPGDFKALSPDDHAVALEIRGVLDSKRLLSPYYDDTGAGLWDAAKFNDICWGTLEKTYGSARCAGCGETRRFVLVSEFSARIGHALLRPHWRDYLRASCEGMIRHAGLMTAVFVVCLGASFFPGTEGPGMFFLMSGIVIFANCFAVEFLSAQSPRLYFYSTELELLCPLLYSLIFLEKPRR